MKNQFANALTVLAIQGLCVSSAWAAEDCVKKHKASYDDVVATPKSGYCVGVVKPENEKTQDPVNGDLVWLTEQSDKQIARISGIPFKWIAVDNGILGVYSAGKNYAIKSWNADSRDFKACRTDIKVEEVKSGATKLELTDKFIRVTSASRVSDIHPGCVAKSSRAYTQLTTEDKAILKKYGTPGRSNELTDPAVAATFKMGIGRDEMIKKMAASLQNEEKRSVLLWGPNGTDRQTIAATLAKKIVEKDRSLPEWIKDWSIFSIDVSLLNEEGLNGKAQKKMTEIVAASAGKKVILLMDDINQLIGVGANEPGGADVTEVMKTPLTDGRLAVIGTLSGDATEKTRFDAKPAFQNHFTYFMVDEPATDVLMQIFREVADDLGSKYNVNFTDEGLSEMIDLTRQYAGGAKHPKLGTTFLEKMAIAHEKTEGETYVVNMQDIRGQVGIQYNVDSLKPVTADNKKPSLKQRVLNYTDDVKKVFVGQEKALEIIQQELMIFAAKTKRKSNKPPVFLFLGPSGVGKTYLATLTAELLDMKYQEYNMEGFTEAHSISGLKGSPQGYVGSDSGGPLMNFISQNPNSVLNFDEIDKAHPDVLTYLMGLFEQGKVMDAKTNVAEFKGMIFLASNFAMEMIDQYDRQTLKITDVDAPSTEAVDKSAIAKNEEDLKKQILDKLQKDGKMGTYIVGRIGLDNIVIFHHLTKEQNVKIAQIEVNKVLKELREQTKAQIDVEEALLKYILEKGFSFRYGARPVRDMAKKLIEGPVSKTLLLLEGQEFKRLVVGITREGGQAKGVVRVENE